MYSLHEGRLQEEVDPDGVWETVGIVGQGSPERGLSSLMGSQGPNGRQVVHVLHQVLLLYEGPWSWSCTGL